MYRLLLLSLLVIAACGAPETSSNEEAAEVGSTTRETTTPDKPPVTTEVEEVATGISYFYGQIGEFGPFVHLVLQQEEEFVSGRYFYAEHQQALELEGTIDESGSYTLDEFHDGEMTGRWKFIKDENGGLTGEWVSKPPSGRKLSLVANAVSAATHDLTQEMKFVSYAHRFETGMFNPSTQTEEVFEAESLLKIGFLGAQGFLFWYDVIGTNAHIGNLEGFAHMTSGSTAEFASDDGCILGFVFDGDKGTVTITEKDCEAFRGARAFFEGELQKEP
ncbi:MAG: hypothetical protein AAF433_12890 [Bacteroidota bacterium]